MTQCSGWQSPGWSNPNLLVNWDFRNPVNQRGQKAYGQLPQYSIDMWRISADYANVSVEDGYLQLSSNDINGYGGIAQYLEFPPAGEKVTLSVCMRPYTKIGQGQNVLADVSSEKFQIYTYSFQWDTENIYIFIKALEAVIPGEPIADIKAIKLEVGSISTLALDLMQPSDYAAELRKCQRYFQKGRTCRIVASKTNYDNEGAIVNSEKLPAMRISPTITLKDIWAPGYYDISKIDIAKFTPCLCDLENNKSFYVTIEKQGMDNFENLLGRCIIFDYEASAEL